MPAEMAWTPEEDDELLRDDELVLEELLLLLDDALALEEPVLLLDDELALEEPVLLLDDELTLEELRAVELGEALLDDGQLVDAELALEALELDELIAARELPSVAPLAPSEAVPSGSALLLPHPSRPTTAGTTTKATSETRDRGARMGFPQSPVTTREAPPPRKVSAGPPAEPPPEPPLPPYPWRRLGLSPLVEKTHPTRLPAAFKASEVVGIQRPQFV